MVDGRISVALLGPFELRVDGQPVSLPSFKPRALIAALALSVGRPVTLESLAEILWGDNPPAGVRPTIHTYVRRSRTSLGDAIVTDHGGYRLDIEPDRVDLHRFRRLVAAASGIPDPAERRTILVEALGLWRGTPLDDLRCDWLRENVQPGALEELLSALERRIDLDLRLRQFDGVVAELREVAAAHPLRESLWLRLMIALAQTGRPAEALDCYATLRHQLAEQLGIDPSPAVQQIYQELLAGEQPSTVDIEGFAEPPQLVPRQLPSVPAQLLGRRNELAALDQRLPEFRSGSAPVVVLTGVAGVGKTALAAHWAHGVRNEFADGQLYVDLRGFGPGDPLAPGAILDGFLRSIGISGANVPADTAERAAMWRTAVADRNVLIVLDNARDAEQVRPLLPGAGCLTVVTSRNQLRGLRTHDGAHHIVVDRLDVTDAIDMLGQHSRADPAVSELVERCDGLPLALRLITDRLAHESVADLLVELRDERARLAAFPDADDAASDLRAVFSWSYQALPADVAALFRLLGMLPGSIVHTWSAAALAGKSIREAGRLLDRLANVHLLERSAASAYRIHDLIHSYAAELGESIDPAAVRSSAVAALAEWCAYVAADISETLAPRGRFTAYRPPPGQPATPTFADAIAATDWFQQYAPTLQAVARLACDHQQYAPTARLSDSLASLLYGQSRWNDTVAVTQVGLVAARATGDANAESALLLQLGNVAADRRRYEVSMNIYKDVVAIARRVHDQRRELSALANISLVYNDQGRYQDGLDYGRMVLALSREIGDTYAEPRAINIIAMDYIRLNDPDSGLRHGIEALDIFRLHNDALGCSLALDTIGQAHAGRGEYQQAIESYRASVDAITKQVDANQDAIVRLHLGEALAHIGNLDAARDEWQQALTTFQALGSPQADDVKSRLTHPKSPTGAVDGPE